MTKRNHLEDLRGASRLAIEATRGVVDLVEAMHRTIGAGPAILGKPLDAATRALIAPVYAGVRGVTGVVGATIDGALGALAPLLGDGAEPRPEHEAVLAAVNGVLGDYLAESRNPLAIEMRFRVGGQPLVLERSALMEALPNATGKLLVLVHGSCMNDLMWSWRGHDHGAALARDLGLTPVYLHYNSGLHISTNGRAFAALLEQLVAAWPVPLEELDLLAHSMGGLVARSACHYGALANHAWLGKLRKLVCLGVPHHGAPLERGGNLFEVALGASRYSAPLARLGKIRSAGVTDLRYGNVVDEDWQGRDRFEPGEDRRSPVPLPRGVACHAIAATASPFAETGAASPLRSDGLVPVESALGRCERAELTLGFPEANCWVAHGAGHVDLLSRADVYAKLLSWFA